MMVDIICFECKNCRRLALITGIGVTYLNIGDRFAKEEVGVCDHHHFPCTRCEDFEAKGVE